MRLRSSPAAKRMYKPGKKPMKARPRTKKRETVKVGKKGKKFSRAGPTPKTVIEPTGRGGEYPAGKSNASR